MAPALIFLSDSLLRSARYTLHIYEGNNGLSIANNTMQCYQNVSQSVSSHKNSASMADPFCWKFPICLFDVSFGTPTFHRRGSNVTEKVLGLAPISWMFVSFAIECVQSCVLFPWGRVRLFLEYSIRQLRPVQAGLEDNPAVKNRFSVGKVLNEKVADNSPWLSPGVCGNEWRVDCHGGDVCV